MFEELNIIELTHDIKKENLKEGSKGTIVDIYKGGEAYEVEFISPDGKTNTLLTLLPTDIRRSNLVENVEFPYRYESSASIQTFSMGALTEKVTVPESQKLYLGTNSEESLEEFNYPSIPA